MDLESQIWFRFDCGQRPARDAISAASNYSRSSTQDVVFEGFLGERM